MADEIKSDAEFSPLSFAPSPQVNFNKISGVRNTTQAPATIFDRILPSQAARALRT
jgi:hypothetical protein